MFFPIKILIFQSFTVTIRSFSECLILSSGFPYYLHELAHILQKIVPLLFYINKNTNRHFIISKVILVHKWALCVIVNQTACMYTTYVLIKFSQFRKDFLKFSFAPKTERKYFCISALKRSQYLFGKFVITEKIVAQRSVNIPCLLFGLFVISKNETTNSPIQSSAKCLLKRNQGLKCFF